MTTIISKTTIDDNFSRWFIPIIMYPTVSELSEMKCTDGIVNPWSNFCTFFSWMRMTKDIRSRREDDVRLLFLLGDEANKQLLHAVLETRSLLKTADLKKNYLLVTMTRETVKIWTPNILLLKFPKSQELRNLKKSLRVEAVVIVLILVTFNMMHSTATIGLEDP